MRRREFITFFGVAALAGPRAARAQQADRVRSRRRAHGAGPLGRSRRTVLRFAGFLQGLQKLGWTEGRNVRIDYRWAAADADRFLAHTRGGIRSRSRRDVIPGLRQHERGSVATNKSPYRAGSCSWNVIDPVGAWLWSQ